MKAKVTNKDKFFGVDLSGLRKQNGNYWGAIEIETLNGSRIITGEHGANDYQEEHGFIITE